ncbi:hypothetical protein [Leifsonia shinshuensis]
MVLVWNVTGASEPGCAPRPSKVTVSPSGVPTCTDSDAFTVTVSEPAWVTIRTSSLDVPWLTSVATRLASDDECFVSRTALPMKIGPMSPLTPVAVSWMYFVSCGAIRSHPASSPRTATPTSAAETRRRLSPRWTVRVAVPASALTASA